MSRQRWDGSNHREREIEDVRGIRAAGTSEKREDQTSSSSRKRQKTSAAQVF